MMSLERTTALATNRPQPGKKYFSLDETNRSLIYVRPIANEMCDCYARVMQLRRRIDQCSICEKEMLEAELETWMDKLGDLVDELNYVGVEIKDFEKALIDFPAVHQGREIYYCWHLGENAVQTWHEIDTGFAGRQDVVLLKAA